MKTFSALARLDWLMLFALMFPIQVVTAAGCLFDSQCDAVSGLAPVVIEVLLISLFVVGLALLVDRARTYRAGRPETLNVGVADRLVRAVNRTGVSVAPAILRRTKVLKSDLSLGAHVHGVLKPHVVISGGMLVGVLRGDKRAVAILMHEVAHVEHFDQLLPGVIGLCAFEIVGRLFKFVTDPPIEGMSATWVASFSATALVIVCLMVLAINRISVYREFYADAKALALTGERDVYAAVLREISGRESKAGGFFHPSPATRLKQVENNFQVLRKALFWKLYWSAVLVTSWFQWWMARLLDSEGGGGHTAQYAGDGAIVALTCLCFELTRKMWAPAVAGSRPDSAEIRRN